MSEQKTRVQKRNEKRIFIRALVILALCMALIGIFWPEDGGPEQTMFAETETLTSSQCP